jgi:hypothetical protein
MQGKLRREQTAQLPGNGWGTVGGMMADAVPAGFLDAGGKNVGDHQFRDGVGGASRFSVAGGDGIQAAPFVS